MKKIMFGFVALLLVFGMAACGESTNSEPQKKSSKKEVKKDIHKKSDLSKLNVVGDYAENDLKTKFTLLGKTNNFVIKVPPIEVSNSEAYILEISNIANDDVANIKDEIGVPDGTQFGIKDKLYYLLLSGDIKNNSKQSISFNGMIEKLVTPSKEQIDSIDSYTSKNSVNDYEPNAKRSGEGDSVYIGKNLNDKDLYGEYIVTTGVTMDSEEYTQISNGAKYILKFNK